LNQSPELVEEEEGEMPFAFERLEIEDVVLVRARCFADSRGFFAETYKRSEFVANGIREAFVQDNLSHSVRGALRGLHYQAEPDAQGKLVMALRGEIYDVAVDIRRGSPTFGRWLGVTLRGAPVEEGQEAIGGREREMLYVPPGFAHGFCVLSEEADVLYKVTAEYAPALERGIVWDDPDLRIPWPVEVPIVSAKDAGLPRLKEIGNRGV
jgi:dTDP-4-dehydrorhamnose 3,5-epimerase